MRKCLRVLHVLGALDHGGVERWLRHILSSMHTENIEFSLCALAPQPGVFKSEVEQLGVNVLHCPTSAGFPSFRTQFRKLLRSGQFDVVHSHVHLFSGMILRWAKSEGVPTRVAHSHTTRDDRPDSLFRRQYSHVMKAWIQSYATHGLAASADAATALFGVNWESDRRFRILYHGIDFEPFQEALLATDVRRDLGLSADAPVIGHVGRFVSAKNHHFLMKVVVEILQKKKDVQVLLIGDGPLRTEIEAQAAQMGIADNIHFTGSRADVPRLMRGAMDILIFPSLWEGLPLALLEAQAAGLHCVFSDSITPEIEVLPAQMIRMSLSKTPTEWAEAVIRALQLRRVETHDALQGFAKTDFNLNRNRAILSEIYGAGAA